MRLPAAQSLNQKEFIKSAFQHIVSDELKKIKDSSLSDCLESSYSVSQNTDELWEYNGRQDAHQGQCEDILLEMQRIFYDDLRTEPAGKEAECVETWEDEEDECLAGAVYEHMQLNDEQVDKMFFQAPCCDYLQEISVLVSLNCFVLTALYTLCQDCSTFEVVI